MTIIISQVTKDGRRLYTGTVKAGKRKGESVTANVPDCGYGFKLFWDKVKATFGPNCYTA